MAQPLLIGCDFSSSPSRRKPIVIALGGMSDGCVLLSKLEYFESLVKLENFLSGLPVWLGAFDLPFGLPRELVRALGWPTDWQACIAHYASLSRADIRSAFKSFCDARPVGGKFAHRATDLPARSSPSMKWVNPPVAYMLHAGVPLLLRTNASFPGLHPVESSRIALEAYPGLLMRELLGRQSYKSDTKAKQTVDRLHARAEAVASLEAGRTRLGLALQLNVDSRTSLIRDASGDSLDAVLCLLQAAWATRQQAAFEVRRQASFGERQQAGMDDGPGWGLPAFDPLEGWIVGS